MPKPRYLQVPNGEVDDSEATHEVPLVHDDHMVEDEQLPSYSEAADGKAQNAPSSCTSSSTAVFVLPSYDDVQQMKRQHNEAQSSVPTQVHTTSDSRLGEYLVGTDAAFILAFLVAFLLNGIGFLCAFCMSSTLAGRYGATSGFGLALVKISVVFYHVYMVASSHHEDDDDYLFEFGVYSAAPPSHAHTNSTAQPDSQTQQTIYGASPYYTHHPGNAQMWLSFLLLMLGIVLFFHGIIAYVRAKSIIRRNADAL